MRVKFRTSDKQIICLGNDVLSKMKLLRRYVDSERKYIEADEIIEDLPFLHSAEVQLIKRWCDLHKNNPENEKSAANDRAFFEQNRPYILNILDAAFKLEIDSLLDACILYLDDELQKGNFEEVWQRFFGLM
ncbi:unnamed protein product [Hymenolepis diminuta]|uniref:Skp1_POZ domain-containing protein n=2 Tax=Hymenolepis diminuta TaxID=6216 RepID=A0A0R3S8E9_HYMDI|nr:unnamed protein product [Hymenolepis diminuta]